MEFYPDTHLVVVVLGKRLVNNELTPEGHGRICTLIEAQRRYAELTSATILFCGGVTQGQNRAEADVLCDAYLAQLTDDSIAHPLGGIWRENQSTTTVENIEFVARMLIKDIAPCHASNTQFQLMLVSTDYHLERIFQIQHWMPQQGLLSRLLHRCEQANVSIQLPLDVSQHIVAPYPYTGPAARCFQAIEALTPYRVYLEGLCQGVLKLDSGGTRLSDKASPSECLEFSAYEQAHKLAYDALEVLSRVSNIEPYWQRQIHRVSQLIANDPNTLDKAQLWEHVQEFHALLLDLNRYFDPENQRLNKV
ncbi:YdcF family protein [Vibrio sp. SM6]|uniref:YdcF family protein n=1 Tax=Vibrio agarilyticus TaxID=2726741 RepID=A0A7X8YFR1_9VIBR|nr:YdcF family protein [Vibrio agarilyticus]NLS11815.1 YdcF family protein [Vibrio agarilyticus]